MNQGVRRTTNESIGAATASTETKEGCDETFSTHPAKVHIIPVHTTAVGLPLTPGDQKGPNALPRETKRGQLVGLPLTPGDQKGIQNCTHNRDGRIFIIGLAVAPGDQKGLALTACAA